jgi:hypothetical protein
MGIYTYVANWQLGFLAESEVKSNFGQTLNSGKFQNYNPGEHIPGTFHFFSSILDNKV